MEALAREHKPRIIVAGASAYSLRIDWERFAKISKEVGAIFWVDMAHYAGLIAAGYYPNPVPFADVVTSTTHKTLRGPRGGVILMKAEHEKALNSAIFPGLQGGPLEHVIAAKAVAFKEAATPGFKRYQEQVINNARVMAKVLGEERGLRIVSGRTESHVFLDGLMATARFTEQADGTWKVEPWTVLLCNVTGSRKVYPGVTMLQDPTISATLRTQLEACVARTVQVEARVH